MKSKLLKINLFLLGALLLCSINSNAQALFLRPGVHVVMNGNISLVVNSTGIKDYGTFSCPTCSVIFTGYTDTSASYITGDSVTSIAKMTVSKPAYGVAIKGATWITDVLTMTAGQLYPNTQLSIISNAGNTARVAPVPTTCTIPGKTIVQRYVPPHRAWRLMTVPMSSSGAQTISAAWQEGAVDTYLGQRVNPVPGYGTHITGGPTRNAVGVGNTSGNGFDAGPNNTSIYSFTGSAWAIPANTSSTLITSNPGYLLFVRGDRSTNLTLAVNAPSSPTVLLPTGQLNIGTQTYNYTGTGFNVVSNPFASSISYATLSTSNSNASSYYYTMDPYMTGNFGVGAFEAYVPDGHGGYSAVPDPSVTTVKNTHTHAVDLTGAIESGAAFIIYDSGSVSSVTIKESDKIAGSNIYLFRPAGNANALQQLRTNFYSMDATGENNLLDGVLDLYDNSFNSAVNLMEDVKKFGNPGDDICLLSAGKLLAAEKRKPLNTTDTVFYNLLNLQHTSYTLEFIATNLNQNGLVGMIKDNYLGTSTPLDMNGATLVNFSTDNTAASKAASRFMIVFSTPIVTPVTFTNIQALQQNKNVVVQWQVENQLNVKEYEVEKSSDGVHFVTVATVAATGNTQSDISYSWIDTNPTDGENYYRVRSIDNGGTTENTQIVNVNIGPGAPSITIYPNPATDGVINLQLNHMPEGTYNVRLLDAIGQVVLTKGINHNAGISTETIQYETNLAKGDYQLQVINPNGSSMTTKVLIQ